MTDTSSKHLIVQRADRITAKKLRWLWPGRVPLGKVTIFAGIPGEGKSLATIDVAARVTTGRNYPDAVNPLSPSEVLFVSEEDDPEDALIPRLIAASADLSKVHFLRSVRTNQHESDLRLDSDINAIKQYLRDNPKIRCLVIDPISNHLGQASMLDEQQVRGILGALKKLAQAHDVSIVCVMHLNKKEGLTAIHRVGGAGAFVGLARASWLFQRGTGSPPKRFMLPLKNNYAKGLSGLGYQIDEQAIKIEDEEVLTPHIEWLGESDLRADEVLSAPRCNSPRVEAESFLETFLAERPQDATTITAVASANGISERTLNRAKENLGIRSKKKGNGGWEWIMPDSQSNNANVREGNSGNVGSLQGSPAER